MLVTVTTRPNDANADRLWFCMRFQIQHDGVSFGVQHVNFWLGAEKKTLTETIKQRVEYCQEIVRSGKTRGSSCMGKAFEKRLIQRFILLKNEFLRPDYELVIKER